MIKKLYCTVCGLPREVGHKMCRECYLKDKRQKAKERYKKFGRYFYYKRCIVCNKNMKAWKSTQTMCSTCYKKYQSALIGNQHSTNNYNYIKEKPEHRVIVEKLLGYKLKSNQVIHHIDGNVKNNSLKNLIVLSRKDHGKLHQYLRYKRVILEKSKNENFEDCWKPLITSITTTWLETTGVNVIKIWKIGQSAGEPLKQKFQLKPEYRNNV